jgi:hypothetical protein
MDNYLNCSIQLHDELFKIEKTNIHINSPNQNLDDSVFFEIIEKYPLNSWIENYSDDTNDIKIPLVPICRSQNDQYQTKSGSDKYTMLKTEYELLIELSNMLYEYRDEFFAKLQQIMTDSNSQDKTQITILEKVFKYCVMLCASVEQYRNTITIELLEYHNSLSNNDSDDEEHTTDENSKSEEEYLIDENSNSEKDSEDE